MRYFKTISDGYIMSVMTGLGGEEITAEEYHTIMEVIKNAPTAPDGYGYRLKEDLTWELWELPVVEEELTADEALAIILGGEA